jgi:hypothetical protein
MWVECAPSSRRVELGCASMRDAQRRHGPGASRAARPRTVPPVRDAGRCRLSRPPPTQPVTRRSRQATRCRRRAGANAPPVARAHCRPRVGGRRRRLPTARQGCRRRCSAPRVRPMSMHAYTPVLHTGTDAARAVNRVETDVLGRVGRNGRVAAYSGAYSLLPRGGWGTHTAARPMRKTAPADPVHADDIQTPYLCGETHDYA